MSPLGAQLALSPPRLEVPGPVFPSRRDFRTKGVASHQITQQTWPHLPWPQTGSGPEHGRAESSARGTAGSFPVAGSEMPSCPWLRKVDCQAGGRSLLATHLSHGSPPLSLLKLGMTKYFPGWGAAPCAHRYQGQGQSPASSSPPSS